MSKTLMYEKFEKFINDIDLNKINTNIIEKKGGRKTHRDAYCDSVEKLKSCLVSGLNLISYEEESDILKIASSITYKIAKNHCFVDGNKRTALWFLEYFLETYEYTIETTQEEIAKVMIMVVEKSDLDILYNFIKSNLVE